MAINKAVRYEGRWEDASAEYVMGKPKNRTSESAKDGTYLEKDWLIDYEAFFGAVMNEDGSVPNGISDTATNSQIFEAMVNQKQVENRFVGNQNFNVPGDDGVNLPSSTTNVYPAGTEFSKGKFALTELSVRFFGNSGENSIPYLRGDYGSYYQEIEGDFTDEYYGVQRLSGFQEKTGVTISLVNGKTRVTVDVSVASPHTFVFLADRRGFCPAVSDEESLFRSGYGQVKASDGGGELTQDFDELQEVIDKSIGVSGNGGNVTQSLSQVQTILNNAVETTTTTLYTGVLESGDSASLSESIRNFHMISVVLGDVGEDSDVKTMPTDAISSSLAVTSYVIDANVGTGETQATQFSFTNNTTIKSLRTFRDNQLQPNGSDNHMIRKVYGITRL